jgi:hypothetical protein
VKETKNERQRLIARYARKFEGLSEAEASRLTRRLFAIASALSDARSACYSLKGKTGRSRQMVKPSFRDVYRVIALAEDFLDVIFDAKESA